MPVSAVSPVVEHIGNGVTTVFPYGYKILANADMTVWLDDVLQTGGYTVSGAGADAGGNVTFSVAPAASVVVRLQRVVSLARTTDYQEGGAFRADQVDSDQDKQTMQIQQVNEEVSRALKFPPGSPPAAVYLPTPEPLKFLGWDQDAGAVVNYDPADFATLAATSNWNYKLVIGDGTAMLITLDDNPGVIANLDISVGGVTQTPVIDYTISGKDVQFIGSVPLGEPVLIRYGTALSQGYIDQSAVIGSADIVRDYAAAAAYSGDKDLLYVLCRSTVGDGGHGYFDHIKTTVGRPAANGGTIIHTSGGWLSRQLGNAGVNPKWFGAKGDGVTDDTLALQAALDVGKRVTVPPGIYMTRKLLLKRFGQVFEGAAINGSDAVGTTLRLIAGQATEIINSNAQSFFKISNMTLWGNGSNGVPAVAGARGVVMKNSYTCSMDNVYILYTDDWGIVIEECNNIRLSEVQVTNVEGGGLRVFGAAFPVSIKWYNGGVENYRGTRGISLESGYGHILSGLWCECGVAGNAYYSANAAQQHIWVDANQTLIENNELKNNIGTGLNGIYITDCVRATLRGNNINNVSGAQVVFAGTSSAHNYFGPLSYLSILGGAGTHFLSEGSNISRVNATDLAVGTTTINAYVDANAWSFDRTTGTTYGMHATGTASGVRYSDFVYGGVRIGSISQSGTAAVAYNTSSDYRLKRDFKPVSDAVGRVKQLNPINFAWESDGTRVDGFLAHEVADVVANAVTGEKDAVNPDGSPDYQAIDHSKLVPLLTAALQECIARIEVLESNRPQ